MTIGFQGEAGAFSDAAARRLRPGAQTRGYLSFDILVAAVDAGDIDAALLPVENSIAGSIPRSYDLLWDYHNLHAVAETAFPVEMNLIGTPDSDCASFSIAVICDAFSLRFAQSLTAARCFGSSHSDASA